jgi:cob(I)alamin adenosyltransferase
MSEPPRILLITGDGKGKTTAALGLALRSAGHAMRVMFVQFVKQDETTGECAALRSVDNVEIVTTGRGFLPPADSEEFSKHREAAQAGLNRARQAVASGDYATIVLDEICIAISRGLIDEQDVLELCEGLSDGMCLVMTGRYATSGLVAAADTVSEVQCIKHALQTGRPAQKGVER